MLNFKNKAEREDFVKNYRCWTDDEEKAIGDLCFIPALNLRFYRYDFANGAVLIVTEYQRCVSWQKEAKTECKYCLILLDGDNYNPYDQNSGHGAADFASYTPDGCSFGTVIDYMTKKRNEI